MLAGEGLEEGAHGADFSTLGLIEASADALDAFEELLAVEELLVRFGTLDYEFGLAVYGKHGGFFQFL